MTTRIAAASAAVLLSLSPTVFGQELLMRYTFDDPLDFGADSSGYAPLAPLTLFGSAAAGYSTNTPSGTGGSFFTGNGNKTYLTTGTTSDFDNGDVDKVDGLAQFTLTMWVNFSKIDANDRLLSDGGAPSGNPLIEGFDLLAGTDSTANNLLLGLSVDGTSANSGVRIDAQDKWVFIAVTYDGTLTESNVAFYAGGLSLGVTRLGGLVSLNKGPVGDNDRPFRIGDTTQTTSDRTPTGYFDDVRVYSGVASQEFLDGVRLANVPEPSTALLLLGGVMGAGALRWRRKA